MITKKRYRFGTPEPITVQEEQGLKLVSLYMDLNDFKRYALDHMGEDDQEKYKDCTFLPFRFDAEKDLSYTVTMAIVNSSQTGRCL